ncbi:hypothetical protein CO038_03865 [Candidatus Pacearchaeota archaeon CG_4_9_14_0_2_um_filter_39_13]|nr:cupin fold metalloprotein, WbuC family [Candidatus Pacearchaeota archaeon]OIO44052.1 MAG: hypothetical protein AUJ64_00870 [Candidatus Pacearchaeota archaeon CG1_02_39_14]PJC44413.1 MAG: hypothetical protein CO038_03865 [Candidatus Pacearchaeota archaeon CG_4_9_14_0_2_um_filter_39_13]
MRFEDSDLFELIEQARNSDRRRAHKALHPPEHQGIRGLLMGVVEGSYVQPHMHPTRGKNEMLVPLNGRFTVVYFDTEGRVTEHLDVSRKGDGDSMFAEVPDRTYHTVIFPGPTLMLEMSRGPYNPKTDKEFALWAPSERDSRQDIDGYIESLKSQIGMALS